ncbi:WD40-repeat-containing domain protein [Zopfochytrium polystomum]|nr:WD40-repeat-containing domain protein [Zopfochytrium polystomum]
MFSPTLNAAGSGSAAVTAVAEGADGVPIHPFDAGHEDLIHDVAYDFYGKRLVTCSSDQKLKVWDFNEESSAWTLSDAWRGHDGSILRVSWAHPEFGNFFASCSFDWTVKIWEEQELEQRKSGRRWKERAVLKPRKAAVQAVEFAPNHLGIKLATFSADGCVRIFEAMDPSNISQWQEMGGFDVTPNGRESDRFCLSWCPSRFQPEMIVVGCGKENCARIYLHDSNNWTAIENLDSHQDTVTDVAWAPNMGRSYQLIATASKDGRVRIFKLVDEDRPNLFTSSSVMGTPRKLGRLKAQPVASFADHGAEVWRVDWNVVGTVLSSSGDDGKIRLWKSGFLDDWGCWRIISAEGVA